MSSLLSSPYSTLTPLLHHFNPLHPSYPNLYIHTYIIYKYHIFFYRSLKGVSFLIIFCVLQWWWVLDYCFHSPNIYLVYCLIILVLLTFFLKKFECVYILLLDKNSTSWACFRSSYWKRDSWVFLIFWGNWAYWDSKVWFLCIPFCCCYLFWMFLILFSLEI